MPIYLDGGNAHTGKAGASGGTHCIKYLQDVEGNPFCGMVCVVLSTWSKEGPQPQLFSYTKALAFKGSMCQAHAEFGNKLEIIPQEQAWPLAAAMADHLRGQRSVTILQVLQEAPGGPKLGD